MKVLCGDIKPVQLYFIDTNTNGIVRPELTFSYIRLDVWSDTTSIFIPAEKPKPLLLKDFLEED